MLDALVIGAYFAAVFAIGLYHSKNKRTSSDYFLAGRNVGWFAVGASLLSTNISSEHFIGLAGSGASSGLAVGCYELGAAFCLLLLGWLFVPHYLRSGVFTMPEFLERRFDARCRWYLTIVSLAAYVFTKISVHLYAGALLMREVAGWDYLTTSILLVVATGIYTILGGLEAVIYTDLMQSFVLLTGAVVLSALGLERAGGFEGLRAALPGGFFHMIKPASDASYPWPGTTLGVLILGIWYWCTDQSIVQKTLAARNLTEARKGTFFCAALKILPLFCLVLPGLAAKAIYGTEVTGDNAFPLLVTRLMPAGLKGLMVAALMAALMSGMSSALNSCSTLITIDIYRKRHPSKSEAELVWFGRVTTGVVVALSILWIPIIPYMSGQVYQYMQSVQAYVAAPITAVFLAGVLWRGATAQAAFLALSLGGAAGAFRFVLDVLRNAGGLNLGPLAPLAELSFLYFAIAVFFACLLLIVVVSKAAAVRHTNDAFILSRHWQGTTAELVWSIGVIAAVVYTWAHFA